MEIIITSVIAFASTNIDDLFILTLFYGNKRFKDTEVTVGQFLGISSLIAMSLIGSLLGILVDQAFMGLLGVIPILLGAKGIWALLKDSGRREEKKDAVNSKGKGNLFLVAGTTIANGGDNIGIYVPLFATFTWVNKMTMVAIFLLMTFVWCLTAKYLVKHPYVAKTVEKYGHVITPFVLVLLGVYILYENRTFELLRIGM